MSIPPEVQKSIDRGLAYLARTQMPDGGWPTKFGRTTGIVGSCALAFMASGTCPTGDNTAGMSRARWISSSAAPAPTDSSTRKACPGMPMYHHGIATLALAEAWGTGRGEGSRDPQSAYQRDRLDCPHPEPARWLALPAAADLGRGHVGDSDPDAGPARGTRRRRVRPARAPSTPGFNTYESCHDPASNGFKYQPSGDAQFNMTAAGVLSLQFAGQYDAPEVVAVSRTSCRDSSA